MTDMKRLEEIKSRVWKDKGTYVMGDYSQREGYIYTLSDYDYEWLIQQAERVEKLEIRLSINTNNMKLLQKENERYKQALEFYADEDNYCVSFEDDFEPILQDNGKKAREALGVDKFETRQNRND